MDYFPPTNNFLVFKENFVKTLIIIVLFLYYFGKRVFFIPYFCFLFVFMVFYS